MQNRIGSKKIRKDGNGNFFQNLIRTVANLFGKKKQLIFFNGAYPETLSFMSYF